MTGRPTPQRVTAVLPPPPGGPRAQRDYLVVIWLGISHRLITADAHRYPGAVRLRSQLDGVERRVAKRHPVTLGRLLAWETQWLHVGGDLDADCAVCTQMRTEPPPVRSPFVDRAWSTKG